LGSLDFDPHWILGSSQAGRLRSKLTNTTTRRSEDPIIVELPKEVTFFPSIIAAPPPNLILEAWMGWPGRTMAKGTERRWGYRGYLTFNFLGAALRHRLADGHAKLSSGEPGKAVVNLTRPRFASLEQFVAGQEEPWVVFSNAAFVGRPSIGMQLLRSRQGFGAADPGSLYRSWRSAGGAASRWRFRKTSSANPRQARQLFSLDDAKNNDLISSARLQKI